MAPDRLSSNVVDDIPTKLIWNELIYIRKKVDRLETMVLLMFGSVSVIGIAVAVIEYLGSHHV